MNKGKLIGGLLLSAFIPLLVFYVVFMGPGIAQGRYTLLVSDLNGQYVNYFLYFKNAIAEGDNLFYSFSMLLGGDTVSLLGYYMLSPLNLILLFWPAEKIAGGIFWLIAVKVALTGVTSFLFFTRKRGVQLSTLLFSTTYALSGYLFAYFMHVMWLDALYMLPLVIMGLELLVEKKKKVLYIVSLAVAIVICFYTGYMIAGFGLLYFIYLQIKDKKGVKERLGEIGRFAWTSILAAALSAFSLLPVLLSHMGNRKAQTNLEYGALHKVREILSKLFTGMFSYEEFMEGSPNIYVGMAVLLLVVLFMVSAKGNERKVIAGSVLLAALLASFYLGALDLVWHGFARPNCFNHRYSFTFVFALVVIAEEFWESKKGQIAVWNLILADLIVVSGIAYVGFKKQELENHYLLIFDVVAVIVTSVLVYFYQSNREKWKKGIIFGLLLCQTVQLFFNARVYIGVHTYDDHSTEGYYAAVEPLISEVKAIDSGLYRMEKSYLNTHNDPMMFSYNGLSHFSSTDKGYARDFLGKLGYNQFYDFWVYYDKGATPAADSFLGVKYILSAEPVKHFKEAYAIRDQKLYMNTNALELGTVCSAEVKDVVLNTGEPFVCQEKIYSAMCGEVQELFLPYEEIERSLTNVTEDNMFFLKTDGETEGIISLTFTARDTYPVYMHLPSIYNPGIQVYVNGENVGEYLVTYHRGMIELGSFEAGETVEVELKLHGNHAGFSDIQICGLAEDVLEQVSKKLVGQGWNVVEHNSGRIKADISVKEEHSVLLLSVPYSENWKITVDDVPVKQIKVFDALMALDVTKGEHTVEMKYIPKGVFVGGAVSFGAVLMLLIVILLERKNGKRLAETTENAEQMPTGETVAVTEHAGKESAETEETDMSIGKQVSAQTVCEEEALQAKEQEQGNVFLLSEYKGHCQMCGKQRIDNGMTVWESFSLFEEVEAADLPAAWNMVCLCPICKSMFCYGEVSMKYFLPAVMASVDEGEESKKSFKIRVGEDVKSISYSASHFRNLQAVLERKDGEKIMEKFRYK